MRGYQPQPYPGKMFLYRSHAQPVLPGEWHRRDMGWGGLPAGGLVVTHVQGNHDTILTEPHVRGLARRVRAALTAVQAQ